jgi:hypothetical protein
MESVKGLENTKYKLIKNEDKLVLTDKKTLKSRVLDIEDIDYVVDDNQKLRDANVIENYFRLKDEPYEQKMMTKTADYVKEQKEAEKYGVKNYTDIIENFIKKYNFTNNELHALAAIPDETSIRKFNNRGDADKRAIMNDFKVLKKELSEDKKITDTFTYLKAYFKNYKETHFNVPNEKSTTILVNYLKDPKHYSAQDYNKIKDNDIQNLDDILKLGVEKFDNIELNLLNNWVNRITKIYQIAEVENINKYLEIKYYPSITNKQNEINLFVDKLTILPNPLIIQIYKQDITKKTAKNDIKIINPIEAMPFVLSISNKILDKLIKDKVNKYMLKFDLKKFIKKIVDKGIGYFNTQHKIQKINDIINDRPDDKDKYDFTGTIYIRTIFNSINFRKQRLTIRSGENKPLNIGTWIPDYNELSTQGINIFNQIIDILNIIKKESNDVGKGNMSASGWTDNTLSRIDNILSTLNSYGYGMINPEHLKICRHMVGNVASGWTDKTLSRIDNILSILNNYSSGMINPILLKVMNRQRNFGLEGSGWTDNTLSRIENINNTLSQYI